MPLQHRPPIISKTRYISGRQCHKLLWHMVNATEQIPQPDPELQKKFDDGHRFGDDIKKMYPTGIEIDWSRGFTNGEQQTRKLLKERKIIFEAGFTIDGCHARADVLIPDSSGGWEMYEAKHSEDIKNIYLYDIAFQQLVFMNAGVNITNCYLLMPECSTLFCGTKIVTHNATESLNQYSGDINEKLDEFRMMLSQKVCPDIQPGPHCTIPYKCRMYDVCSQSK
jgi:hypothetical protein